MRKLSESLWSEIQDRSAGITQRKEDDVNLMSGKDFCDYLNDNYIGKDGHKIIYDEISNRISISILKYFTNCFYNITYNYNSNIIIMNDEVESIYPELCKMIKKNFKVVKKIVSNPTYTQFIIFPPDGSECTNRFFVDVVNFIIDNADENVLSFKKKHINESIWSDMQDRSAGETVRKEDDVNILDINGLYEHIYDLYKQVNSFPIPMEPLDSYMSEKKIQCFSIPIFKENYKIYSLAVIFANNKISSLSLMATDEDVRDFKQVLMDNFKVTIKENKALKIEEKDGTLTNQTCMKLISVIVTNAPEPYLKKREN